MVLGTTYDIHLGLIGKRVVDFLLVLIEVFSLGVTAEWLRAKKKIESEPIEVHYSVSLVGPSGSPG